MAKIKNPISDENIKNIRNLSEGGEYTYKELCREIDIPEKGGASKIAQLEEIQKYCELEKIDGTHRYIVRQIYGAEVEAFVKYLDAPEQQLLFDAALYQKFIDNGGKTLYLTNREMLELFGQINANFKFSFNKKALTSINRNLGYMSDVAKVTYRILHQWTARRIDNMDKRHIIMRRYGFRLYAHHEIDGGVLNIEFNVEPNSDMEKTCQRIWNMALSRINGEQYISTGNLLVWMPEEKWNRFQVTIEELVTKEFASKGDYTNMRVISILDCMPQDWLQETVDYIYRTVGSTGIINSKAKEKIMQTTQLDEVCTLSQRKEFIDYNISKKPPMWFKEELNKKEED